jgi:hypothetical protein
MRHDDVVVEWARKPGKNAPRNGGIAAWKAAPRREHGRKRRVDRLKAGPTKDGFPERTGENVKT